MIDQSAVYQYFALSTEIDFRNEYCRNITINEFCILRLIWRAEIERGVSMTMSEIADALHMSKSALSQCIARLELKGLVKRRMHQGDRRIMEVVPTARCQKKFEMFMDCACKHYEEMVDIIGEEDMAQLKRIIVKYIDGIKAKQKGGADNNAGT